MAADTIVIKKYANRRLYDTSNSRYINLEDIGALVRNGKDVQVVDANTGEDITRVTLTQIIFEDAKGQPAGLPLELLRQLIVTTDHVGQEFILWYSEVGLRYLSEGAELGAGSLQPDAVGRALAAADDEELHSKFDPIREARRAQRGTARVAPPHRGVGVAKKDAQAAQEISLRQKGLHAKACLITSKRQAFLIVGADSFARHQHARALCYRSKRISKKPAP